MLSKIDFTTLFLGQVTTTGNKSTTSTTPVGISGLTLSGTVPAGVTKIRIVVTATSVESTTGAGYGTVSLHNVATGSVASGNQATQVTSFSTAAFQGNPLYLEYIATVTPGASWVYSVGLKTSTGSVSIISGGATQPIVMYAQAIG